MCLRSRTNLCLDYHTLGFQADGGMAEFVVAPAAICVPVGERGLTVDTAALAQPMAVAHHARKRGRVSDSDVVLVIGIGGIGSFLTYSCVASGADVWVADLSAERLDLARSLGAAHTIDAATISPGAALAEAGVRADVVFEVSGSSAGLDQAQAATHPGARLVMVGVQKKPYAAPTARWTLSEYDVLGTVAHVCATDIPEAMDLLAGRAEGWDDIAPEVLPLTDLIDEGLIPLAEGRSSRIKTLFDPAATARRPADHRHPR